MHERVFWKTTDYRGEAEVDSGVRGVTIFSVKTTKDPFARRFVNFN